MSVTDQLTNRPTAHIAWQYARLLREEGRCIDLKMTQQVARHARRDFVNEMRRRGHTPRGYSLSIDHWSYTFDGTSEQLATNCTTCGAALCMSRYRHQGAWRWPAPLDGACPTPQPVGKRITPDQARGMFGLAPYTESVQRAAGGLDVAVAVRAVLVKQTDLDAVAALKATGLDWLTREHRRLPEGDPNRTPLVEAIVRIFDVLAATPKDQRPGQIPDVLLEVASARWRTALKPSRSSVSSAIAPPKAP